MIYEDRPEDPCRKFKCGWLTQNSPLPNALRPDKVNWISLPASRTWRGRPVDTLIQAGDQADRAALEWFKHSSSQTGRPLLYLINDEWFLQASPQMQQEFIQRMARGESAEQILPRKSAASLATWGVLLRLQNKGPPTNTAGEANRTPIFSNFCLQY